MLATLLKPKPGRHCFSSSISVRVAMNSDSESDTAMSLTDDDLIEIIEAVNALFLPGTAADGPLAICDVKTEEATDGAAEAADGAACNAAEKVEDEKSHGNGENEASYEDTLPSDEVIMSLVGGGGTASTSSRKTKRNKKKHAKRPRRGNRHRKRLWKKKQTNERHRVALQRQEQVFDMIVADRIKENQRVINIITADRIQDRQLRILDELKLLDTMVSTSIDTWLREWLAKEKEEGLAAAERGEGARPRKSDEQNKQADPKRARERDESGDTELTQDEDGFVPSKKRKEQREAPIGVQNAMPKGSPVSFAPCQSLS